MSPRTTRRADEFWELIDEFLNVGLFMLLGLEVMILPIHPASLWAGMPRSSSRSWLASRSSPAFPLFFAHFADPNPRLHRRPFLGRSARRRLPGPGPRPPPADHRDTLLSAAYAVVVFSIFVQGLTFGPLIRRTYRSEQSPIPAV